MADYSFSGASLGLIGEDSPQLNPAATSSGGWMDSGLEFVGDLADKWLQYQSIRGQVDLETNRDTRGGILSGMSRPASGGVPSWVIVGGALLAGVLIYRAVARK